MLFLSIIRLANISALGITGMPIEIAFLSSIFVFDIADEITTRSFFKTLFSLWPLKIFTPRFFSLFVTFVSSRSLPETE